MEIEDIFRDNADLKFIYSEKATNFFEISTVDLTITTKDKSTVEISQKIVAFSVYLNYIKKNALSEFFLPHCERPFGATKPKKDKTWKCV